MTGLLRDRVTRRFKADVFAGLLYPVATEEAG